MTIALMGFRPHTYWTAAVALAGEPGAPRVMARRRITFAAGDERLVYHHAAEMEVGAAKAWVVKVAAATQANAAREIADFVLALRAVGLTVDVAVVPTGRRAAPDRLADIVKSHTLMHAAEGEFYRDVVARACVGLGLEVRRFVERDLAALACARLRIEGPTLAARLKAMGRELGPPWSEDERLATLAAWVGLAGG